METLAVSRLQALPRPYRRNVGLGRTHRDPIRCVGQASANAVAPSQPFRLAKAILQVAGPTTLSLAIEPLAALISTAFVGHLGTSQLAGVGAFFEPYRQPASSPKDPRPDGSQPSLPRISLTLFNSFTKLFNMPLLAIITTYMAAVSSSSPDASKQQHQAMKSCAVLTLVVGLVQTALLLFLMETGVGLRSYGITADSLAYIHARAYLGIRVVGNMVSVVFFAMLGVFRGLQDSVSPLVAMLLFAASSVCLEYLMLFQLSMGPEGAALAVVAAQCLGVALQMALLKRRHQISLWNMAHAGNPSTCDGLKSPSIDSLSDKLSMCGILMFRTSLVMLVYGGATSLIARAAVPALSAAHQIAFQLWMASSLLADSLAVAAQSLMAKSMSQENRANAHDALEIGSLCLRFACILGCALTAVMHFGMPRMLAAFTKNPEVLVALSTITGWVALSQVISSVAFALDGIVYSFGAPGFRYASLSMLFSASVAIATMYVTSSPLWMACDPLTSSWMGLVALMLCRSVTMLQFFVGKLKKAE